MKQVYSKTTGIILACLAALLLSPTVLAGNTGTAVFSIVGTVSLTVPVDTIDFGSGSPAAGNGSTIASNAADNPSTWNDNPGGFVVENDGNVDIEVKVYADKTAAAFIGGTNPAYKSQSSNNEAGSCASGLQGSWTDMTQSAATASVVCSSLGYANTADSIVVDIELFIPADAPVVTNSMSTVTFTAMQV